MKTLQANLVVFLTLSCTYYISNGQITTQPNIIFIVADDLGRSDVSYNNNNEFIVTPNIDALGMYGIILHRHYAHAMCTPSRGALMTGKYCTHTGLQHNVINNDEPYGMSETETTLPEYLKTVGYKTHLVGKWHLGASKVAYNPVRRGFDTFTGYLGGFISYHNHDLWLLNQPLWPAGYDFRTNETIDYGLKGVHATEVFTNKAIDVIQNHNKSSPLFLMVTHLAPHSENFLIPFPNTGSRFNKEYYYIKNPLRKRLAVEISLMDESVGRIVGALEDKGILQNSVVIFISDNGAPTLGLLYNLGSNYPLKGQKDSPWEGATRVPGVIWSPLLKKNQYVSRHLMHVTDWPVTLATLAGVNLTGKNLDGVDMWDTLSNNRQTSPRTQIVHNVDDYTSFIQGDFKYVTGTTNLGIFDWWIGHILQQDSILNFNKNAYYNKVKQSQVGNILKYYTPKKQDMNSQYMQYLRNQATIYCSRPKKICLPLIFPCLFNIVDDPCEHENLYFSRPDIVKKMQYYLADVYSPTIVPKRNRPSDPRSNPANFDNTWAYWEDVK